LYDYTTLLQPIIRDQQPSVFNNQLKDKFLKFIDILQLHLDFYLNIIQSELNYRRRMTDSEIIELFQILGNPNRLKIFDILMTGVHCNCELSELTGLAMNLVSHHLKVLQEAELIQSVRSTTDGRWIYYSINEEKLSLIKSIIGKFFESDRIVDREPSCPPCKQKS